MSKDSPSVEQGKACYPFYPNHLFVEGLVAFAALLILFAVALLWQVPLEEIADPSDSAYVPRPEWYFLFLFQLLKYFQGPFIVVGTFILPLLLGVLLVLWPFLDRGEETRISKRPGALALAVFSVGAIIGLSVLAFVEDSDLRMDLPPITEQDIAEGRDIFNRFCVLCHSMGGKGGFMAPDLTHVGGRINRVYIERAIINPTIVSQTTIMSKIPLNDKERHAVSAFLARQK